MIPTVEWRRAQAAAALERSTRTRVLFPGSIKWDDAKRLGPADGPAPEPSPVVDDDITRACARLFDTHKGE